MRKAELLNALDPLCNDVSWMEDLINYLENLQIPDNADNDFEYLGIARKISYELLKEKPNLFNNNTSTAALEALIKIYEKNINVTKNANENFDHMVIRVFNELKAERGIAKKPTTSR